MKNFLIAITIVVLLVIVTAAGWLGMLSLTESNPIEGALIRLEGGGARPVLLSSKLSFWFYGDCSFVSPEVKITVGNVGQNGGFILINARCGNDYYRVPYYLPLSHNGEPATKEYRINFTPVKPIRKSIRQYDMYNDNFTHSYCNDPEWQNNDSVIVSIPPRLEFKCWVESISYITAQRYGINTSR